MIPTAFPIVNATKMVPIPNPSNRPRKIRVIPAVMARQIESNAILIFGYLMRVICASSRGKRSVGTIGRQQRFESAMPKLISR